MTALRSRAVQVASAPRPSHAGDIVAVDPAQVRALEATASRHSHLCPRQVLGVRMGLAGLKALGLPSPAGKRLMAFIETDGCFADGIEAATGCSMGHRTLRLEDYGRTAATFIDLDSRASVRVAPSRGIRVLASRYEPLEERRYYAQLRGYQRIPDGELLAITPVVLRRDVAGILGRHGTRIDCAVCGEEVINQREMIVDGSPVCLGCGPEAYYEALRA